MVGVIVKIVVVNRVIVGIVRSNRTPVGARVTLAGKVVSGDRCTVGLL